MIRRHGTRRSGFSSTAASACAKTSTRPSRMRTWRYSSRGGRSFAGSPPRCAPRDARPCSSTHGACSKRPPTSGTKGLAYDQVTAAVTRRSAALLGRALGPAATPPRLPAATGRHGPRDSEVAATHQSRDPRFRLRHGLVHGGAVALRKGDGDRSLGNGDRLRTGDLPARAVHRGQSVRDAVL